MTTITVKGDPIQTIGSLPAVGAHAPAFTLVNKELKNISLKEYVGKNVVLNIFPSIDTGTCATSTREFNKRIAAHPDTVVICISMDLPFALGRFCAAEGIANVETASAFRNPEFAKDYGVAIATGPLQGLFSRAVVVIDTKGIVRYTEQVSELTHEPNYELALTALV